MAHEHEWGEWVRREHRHKAARTCACGARQVVSYDDNEEFLGVLEVVPSSSPARHG